MFILMIACSPSSETSENSGTLLSGSVPGTDGYSAFGSLQDLLARLLPLLHLILQIPPLDPWSSLRISYLLTFTGSVPTYITSLPLLTIPSHTTSTGDPDLHDVKSFDVEQQTARTMRALLDFPNLVDKGWQAVLRGDGWLPPSKPGGRGKAVRVDYSGSVGVTERYAPHSKARLIRQDSNT